MKKLFLIFTLFTFLSVTSVLADIIDPRVHYADEFFINKQGKKVTTSSQYKKVKTQVYNLNPAYSEDNKKYGYIDSEKNWVIPPKFDYVMGYSDGLAAVKENDKWGYIDTNGNWVIKPKFHQIFCPINSTKERYLYFLNKCGNLSSGFSEGLAAIPLYEEGVYIVKTQDGKKYKAVLPKGFDTKHSYFVNGYIKNNEFIVQNKEEDYRNYKNQLYYEYPNGYINKTGEVVIRGNFKSPMKFSEGLAAVRIGRDFGYINTKGEFVIEPEYSFAGKFVNGVARVKKYNPQKEKEYEERFINPNKKNSINNISAYADEIPPQNIKDIQSKTNKSPIIPFSLILLILIIITWKSIKKQKENNNANKQD